MQNDRITRNGRDGQITNNIGLGCVITDVLTKPRNPEEDEKKEIPLPTSKSAFSMDPHLAAHQHIQTLPGNSERDVEVKSWKDHPQSDVWSVGNSSLQTTERSRSRGSDESRPTSLSTRPERKHTPINGELELGQLRGDSPLDVHDQVETRPSDSDSHNHIGKEKSVSSMPELLELLPQRDLPSLLSALKNDRFGFHPDTSDDLLDEYDLEAINEMCPHPLIGCRPMFADHSGFTMWIVDDTGFMYQYCRMNNSMKLMGHDMVEGLINYLYYPDRLLWLWPETQEWILEEEHKRRLAKQLEGVTYESMGAFEFPSQIARGKPKPKKKRGKKHKH